MTLASSHAQVATLLHQASHRSQHAICLDLVRIKALLHRLEHPEQAGRFIQVAGTNGKGSTVTFLASILQAGGAKVGVYTSPHLHSFNERIRINQTPIDDATLAGLLAQVLAACDDIPATFFEITTAVALLYFRKHHPDWIILETGLGGRLDATNVVHPQLCVITAIDFDHQAFLGTSLAQISHEKGGIIKPHVPVAVAAEQPESMLLLRQLAEEKNAPAIFYGQEYTFHKLANGFCFQDDQIQWHLPAPTLSGDHQYGNAALAIAGLRALAKRGVCRLEQSQVAQGIVQAFIPGRLEQLATQPDIILDGAHNPHATRALCAHLATLPIKATDIIFSALDDKNFEASVQQLIPFTRRVWLTCVGEERAASPQRLQAAWHHLPSQWSDHPATALAQAYPHLQAEDRLLVTGSLYLVAAIRDALQQI